MAERTSPAYDVIVVGAGMAGLYGVKRFREQGLRVLGLEAAPEAGGVWYHNAYPGARVDVESLYYCYFFDPGLYQDWRWTERYASQPELLAYFAHVADRFDLRRHYHFDTRVVAAVWEPRRGRWAVSTSAGRTHLARYLVMATGQLSMPRTPPLPGLDGFGGEWVHTSRWRPVRLAGRRVAVLGTGSSGVQSVTAIAPVAGHTYVLQRTPGYVVPIPNGPFDAGAHARVCGSLEQTWGVLSGSMSGIGEPAPMGRASDFPPELQREILESRWGREQLGIFTAFSDFATDRGAAEVVAEFVREKIRARIGDPSVADLLVQKDYPIGVRRIVFAAGYYEAFDRGDVTLVDVATDPIARVTRTGLWLASGRHLDLDTIVFATGFDAFMGAVEAAGVRNQYGARPHDHWHRGPQTYLGLMTRGFPNLFIVQGPGSPATLSSNMNLSAVHTMNFIAGLLVHAEKRGSTRIEPSEEAVRAWTAHVNAVAEPLLRRQDDNYMVQVNDDGSRVLIPYAGGVGEYNRRCAAVAARGFTGFELAS